MRHRLFRFVILCLIGVGPRVRAQTASEARYPITVMVGATVAAYYTSHPYGAPSGRGIIVGIARRTNDRFALAGMASALWTWTDVGGGLYCAPRGAGCLPDPIFPGELFTLEASGALRPLSGVAIYLLGGGGLAVPRGALVGGRSKESADTSASAKALWRFGAEIKLGGSPIAPRIQITRSQYASSILDLKGMFTLALVLRAP